MFVQSHDLENTPMSNCLLLVITKRPELKTGTGPIFQTPHFVPVGTAYKIWDSPKKSLLQLLGLHTKC